VTTGEVTSEVTGVPCAQPHDAEVIDQIDLSAAAWPGKEAVRAQSRTQCEQRVEQILTEPRLRHLRISVFYPPDQGAWLRNPVASCMVADVEGTKPLHTEQGQSG
jgi:hypothetical protein